MAKADTKYKYTGSLTGVTLEPEKEGDKPREVMLYPGSEVTLPADNNYVKALEAQGILNKIPADEAGVKETPKTQGKKEVSNAG